MNVKSTSSAVVRHGPYPELTWAAILVGYFLGVIIAISIGYAALILGFSIEGSELAAILGFGILRGILRRSSIIENNIAQTVASAVNGASSGMMFSVPAIFILGYGSDFNPVLLTFGAIAGAFLGIGFIIPLRKQMIDYERLTYPGGVAVATILKSPGAGIQKAMLLIGGALLSGGLHAVSKSTGMENLDLGSLIGMPGYMNGVWFLSLMTIGVGYIAGKGGVAFIIGGYVCYWILAPMLSGLDMFPLDPATGEVTADPDALRLLLFRPVGIGMLIGGAIAGVVMAFPMILSAVRSMQNAARTESSISRDEMPIKLLYAAIGGAAVLLVVIAVLSTDKMGLGRGARNSHGRGGYAVDLDSRRHSVGGHWPHQLVPTVRHDPDSGHHPDLHFQRTGRYQSSYCVRHRGWRGGFRGNVSGHRPDAGPQDRIPGGGHTA